MNYHALTIETVLDELDVNLKQGLSEEDVLARRKKFGSNQLPEEKAPSKVKIFLNQLRSPLIFILIIAGTVTLVLQDFTDSIIIFAAVLLNTTIGFFQENKATNILSELKKLTQKEKTVAIRNGCEKEINGVDLVPGDMVILQAGDKVPADARLMEAHQLKVNEAILTGEWLAAEKNINVLPMETPLADRENMIYMGSVIETGRARGIITQTGVETEIGKISTLVQRTKEEKTPYQKKLSFFSKILSIVIMVVTFLIFALGIFTGKDILEMFITSVAVAVAAIPEGLPVAMTVILALGMQRILKKKGLMRNLVASETLGSTTVVATDKTGTLTQAKMQVSGVFTGTNGLLKNVHKSSGFAENVIQSHITALKIAVLANESFIENPKDELHKWIVRGRPTEKALLIAGVQAGLNQKELLEREPQIDYLPFDSSYKYSASLNQLSGADNIIYMLGAPEVMLTSSKYIELDGLQEELTPHKLSEIKEKLEELTSRGLRVLAVSYKDIPKEKTFFEKVKSFVENNQDEHQELRGKQTSKQKLYEKELENMVFVGLITLKDPLRPQAKEAIKTCQDAGMKVVIVTGDHKLTAKAIAQELGFEIKDENILEGKELEKLSDEELRDRIYDIKIYARVEPHQKLKIVQAWQQRGEIIAMTGDGVNDAPALKRADIGVALGSGTAVAKEASDLILLTDDFSILVAAVKEGRRIISNIRKVIIFLLFDGFTEIMLIGTSIIANLPLPIIAAQILWVNLVEGGLPAVSLGFEPEEKDAMLRKPEGLKAPLLTAEMKTLIFIGGIIANFFLIGLFLWLLSNEMPIEEIRTIIFAALTMDSIFYLFALKNLRKNVWQINIFSNKFLLYSWLFAVVALILGVYLPPLQQLLKTVPLNMFDWILVFAIGAVNLILIELVKFIYIKKKML